MTTEQIFANPQAGMEYAMHLYWTTLVAVAAIQLGLFLLGAWVIYMFYSRLRDVANELRYFRIAYEQAQDLRSDSWPHRGPQSPRTAAAPRSDDSRYMPKL